MTQKRFSFTSSKILKINLKMKHFHYWSLITKKMNIKVPTSKINNFLNGKNDIDVYKVYNLLTLSKWGDYFLN